MPIIGLDLGKQSIRAIQLDNDKGKYVLQKHGIYENSRNTLDSDSPADSKKYAESLKHFFAEAGFDTPNVCVSVPEHQVFIRIIKTPKMNEKELKTAIDFEAEQYIPFPKKEMSVSHQIVDANLADPNSMEVMIVAAKKTILDKYIAVLRDAGMVPRAIEPETLALNRIFGKSADTAHATIILHTGFSSTLVIVSYKGAVRFTRSIPIGGDTLTRAIQQSLTLDYAQAEEYKKAYGLDEGQAEGKVYQAIRPVFENIMAEIKRSDIFFTTHNPNASINRVVISGGSAMMPGLLSYSVTNLDSEVELANPWKDIRLSSRLESQKDTILEQGPLFSVAVGLAVKDV